MVKVVNSIGNCLDAQHTIRGNEWGGEVVHRIKIEGCHDASGYARFFRNVASVGNRMPYTLLIHPSGLTEQALPFDVIGWHAVSYSRRRIGIGCIGDFRKEDMPDAQRSALLDVLTWCSLHHAGTVIDGHTELPGATKYQGHECPGNLLNMDAIRADVGARMEAESNCPPNPGFALRLADMTSKEI